MRRSADRAGLGAAQRDGTFLLNGKPIPRDARLELLLPEKRWVVGWFLLKDGQPFLSLELGGVWEEDKAGWERSWLPQAFLPKIVSASPVHHEPPSRPRRTVFVSASRTTAASSSARAIR